MTRKAHAPAHTDALPVWRIPFDGPASALPGKDEVGSKAHNLMVMAANGLPVPPGFVIGTAVCRRYLTEGAAALKGLDDILARELESAGAALRRRFGDARRPLLVSVRSGAAISMPGMMETVLNVGLSAQAIEGLVRLTGNPRLALDCRRRLIQQFAEVVHGAAAGPFDHTLDAALARDGVTSAGALDTDSLAVLVAANLAQFTAATGETFPDDPMRQLRQTVEAVLRSWSSDKAKGYRALNRIDDGLGTAVTVQAMVFGNDGPSSGSGVGFTRNPADGSNALYIDYLPNAQGEDVVAGRRNALGSAELQRRVPAAFAHLEAHKSRLEQAFGDMQDFEFTVEEGRLFMLQARAGKRTPLAALQIAHDLVGEGAIDEATALTRLDGIDLDAIETAEVVAGSGTGPIATAIPASAGVVTGIAVLDPARMAECARRGAPVILVREHAETSDIEAVARAAGLLTARGARTSHAAVVARQLGKVCLVGCSDLSIDPSLRTCVLGETRVNEGDLISIDGGSGKVYAGTVEVKRARPEALLAEVERWRRARSGHAGPMARRPTRRK